MERALLQGEREAERALLQKEQKAVDQLQEKLVTLETGIQKERDKVTPGLAQCWAPVAWERRRKAFSRAPYPFPHVHPADQVVSVPLQGQGALSSVENTSLKGAARVWAGVWGLLCLVSVLPVGAWVSVILDPSRKCRSPFSGSEHSPRDWCWGVTQVWAPASGGVPHPPAQACLWGLGHGLWERALMSLIPLPSLQPPIPDGPSSCPCPLQISCQPAGAAPSHWGLASHVQDAQQRAKSSEVERGHLFLDLTVFFQELIFLLDFLRASSSCPSILKLKNSLTPWPFFGALVLVPKTTLPNSVPN